ncbi:hypothetical protein V5O48_011876 [Marasmius crinis-equi]|uniref:VHS domain-containing protein n=1 Tax=Marasmius crinis-equi TaxID=585013 RepID=A0ABR3F4D4_9AGAR
MASDLTALAPQTSDSLPIGRNISRGTSVSEFSLATAETPPPPYSSVDNIYQLPNEDDGLPSGIHEDASPTPSASSSSRPSQELEPLTTVTREKGARRGPCQKPLPALPGRVETSRKGTGWNERLADDETRIEGTENERRRDGQFARTDSQGELTRLISFLVVTTSENWALVWDVCERVLASENNAKEAARALRRELKYGVPAAQLSAATLWTILLRNSSEAFFRYSTEIKFLDTVEDLIRSPRTSPVVKRRILSVIAIYRKDLRFQELWKRVKPLEYTDEQDVPINSGDTQRHDSEVGLDLVDKNDKFDSTYNNPRTSILRAMLRHSLPPYKVSNDRRHRYRRRKEISLLLAMAAEL